MNTAPSFRRAALVGGAGAVGRLLHTLLQEAGTPTVLVVDRQLHSGTVGVEADILDAPQAVLQQIAACDVVILALPEDAAVAALGVLAPALPATALLVETLSVKTGFAAALAQGPYRGGCLGINPMFAPDLGFRNRGVIVTPHSAGPKDAQFRRLMSDCGARLVEMTADEHDRACAALQGATHAAVLGFGGALLQAGYEPHKLEAIMPPPHRVLLALLGRILAGEPAVYHDIQAANPHAAAMRARLLEAQRELDRSIQAGPDAFARQLDATRGMLSGSGTDYAALCSALLKMT